MTDASSLSVPAAEQHDSDDVRWALETANTLWSQGDHRGALRWLGRAAETAAHEENDLRSLVLARAAADLRGRLQLESSLMPAAAGTGAAEPPKAERTLTGLTLDSASSTAGAASEPAPDSERRARSGSTYLAVRVAVGGGLSNDGGLRVRRLAAGEVTREGEHLAVLVSLEPDVDLNLI